MLATLRSRLPSLFTVALALVLAGATVTAWHPDPACAHPVNSGACAAAWNLGDGDKVDFDTYRFDHNAVPGAAGAQPARHRSSGSTRLVPVGHVDPGAGFNADVVAHDGVAYLGSWGTTGDCPSLGVRAYSLRNPSSPRLLSTFADAAADPLVFGSWTEKVIVKSVRTRSFRGDLAAVSFQSCMGAAGFRGFGVYDVTNPARPVKLALVRTVGNGSHEIWLESRPGKGAWVYTAILNAEVLSSPDFTGDPNTATIPGDPDFQVWDVSRPRAPVRVGGWGAWRELGIRPVRTDADGVRRTSFVHSVTSFGNRVLLSYWDTGTVILDSTNPARPRFLGRTTFQADQEGNAHSTWLARGGKLLIETIEDFSPAPGAPPNSAGVEQAWGYTRVFDVANPRAPRLLSTFELPATRQNPPAAPGFFTVHDPKVDGSRTFFSYYTEGIVLVDHDNPRRLELVDQFKTPPTADPRGRFFGGQPATNNWGVFLHRGLVLVSDINSGLWVLDVKEGRRR